MFYWFGIIDIEKRNSASDLVWKKILKSGREDLQSMTLQYFLHSSSAAKNL